MKKVNIVGALLLSSTALALDTTGQLRSAQLPLGLLKQPLAETLVRDLAKSMELIQAAPKQYLPSMHGTFHASELFWSEENNELYVKGNQVNVSLNTQKFMGSGQFSFVGQLSYLVINGKAMKSNEAIRLVEKAYRLVKLPSALAVKKYGDIAKLGAVEITLAE